MKWKPVLGGFLSCALRSMCIYRIKANCWLLFLDPFWTCANNFSILLLFITLWRIRCHLWTCGLFWFFLRLLLSIDAIMWRNMYFISLQKHTHSKLNWTRLDIKIYRWSPSVWQVQCRNTTAPSAEPENAVKDLVTLEAASLQPPDRYWEKETVLRWSLVTCQNAWFHIYQQR